MKREKRPGISRRRFMSLSGATAAGVLSASAVGQNCPATPQEPVPSYAVPVAGPPGQTPRFEKTDLWVQLTTGGKPYPPSLQEMFLDPMFLGLDIWPIDQPASFDALLPPQAAAAGGRSATGGGTERLEPKDYPWEPSGGRPHPGYDVLVLNDQTEWSEAQRTAAKKAVEAGRGVVVLHHALGDNQDWPWWYQQVTGGLFVVAEREGMKASSASRAPRLELRAAAKHPILRNVGPLVLENEQVYKGVWRAPGITPLLETSHAGSDKIVAWVGVHPSKRVVCLQFGSSRETHRNPDFRMLVRNSILWAGGRLI